MDVIKNFFVKALYGIAGALAGAFLFMAENFKPEGDTVTLYVWNTLIVGAFTGLAGVLKRWIFPSKR